MQGNSQPNKLCIKVSSKQIPKEASTVPKNIWGNMPTKHSLKTNLYQQNIWKEISPQNIFQTLFLPKNYPNRIVYQKNIKKYFRTKDFEEKCLPKNFSRDIKLAKIIWNKWTKNLWRDIIYQKRWEELSPTRPFEEKCLPFFGEKSLPNKFQKKFLPKKLCEKQRLQKKLRQTSTNLSPKNRRRISTKKSE